MNHESQIYKLLDIHIKYCKALRDGADMTLQILEFAKRDSNLLEALNIKLFNLLNEEVNDRYSNYKDDICRVYELQKQYLNGILEFYGLLNSDRYEIEFKDQIYLVIYDNKTNRITNLGWIYALGYEDVSTYVDYSNNNKSVQISGGYDRFKDRLNKFPFSEFMPIRDDESKNN